MNEQRCDNCGLFKPDQEMCGGDDISLGDGNVDRWCEQCLEEVLDQEARPGP